MSTWLNEQIKERGWSIRRFGRVIGVSPTHAARLVNGAVKPSTRLCISIARAFGMRPADVINHVGLIPIEPITKSSLVHEADTELVLMSEAELIMWRDAMHSYNRQRGRYDDNKDSPVDSDNGVPMAGAST